MSPLDKTLVPASSIAPVLTSDVQDVVFGSSVNAAGSNSMANVPEPDSKANVAVSDNLVLMQCRSCRRPFGRVANEWIIFTTGYYLEVKPEARPYDFDLKKGHEIPILNRIKQLRDCILVPLDCKSCKQRIGLVVRSTPPDRKHLLGCTFLKVTRDVIFISHSDVEVLPHVISARYTNAGYPPSPKAEAATAAHSANLAKHQPPKPQDVKAQPVAQRSLPSERSTSSTSGAPQVPPSIETRQLLRKIPDSGNDPDNFAIDVINRGGSWREAHDVWEKMTTRQLSPGAFGKHIQQVGRPELPANERTHQQQSSAPPIVPVAPFPPTQTSKSTASSDIVSKPPGVQYSHDSHKHPTSMLVRQNPTSVAHHTSLQGRPSIVQTTARHPSGDSLREQQQQRKPSANLVMQPDPWLARATQKLINDRMLTLEAGMRVLRKDTTLLQTINKDLVKKNEELREQLSTARPATANAAVDYDAIHSLSEAVMSASTKAAAIDTIKIQIATLVQRVSLLEAWNGRTGIDLPRANQPQLSMTARQTAIPENSAQKRPHDEDGISLMNTETANKRIRTDSVTSTLAPSTVNHHPYSSPSLRRGRGRPRKQYHPSASMSPGRSLVHQSANIPSSTLQARPNEVISDGYFASHENMPHDRALGPDRGRVVRRGTGGVNMTPPSEGTIRRRTKPVRNEEGILIRLDGKPDMRSISSAQNLKKRHDTQREPTKDQPGVGSLGLGSTMTSGSTNKQPFNMTETVISNSDDDDEKMNISILEQFKRPVREHPRPLDHETVLKGMFPKGINHATGGIDIAAKVFARNSKPAAALQERTAIVNSVNAHDNDNNKSLHDDGRSSEE